MRIVSILPDVSVIATTEISTVSLLGGIHQRDDKKEAVLDRGYVSFVSIENS